MREDGRCYVEVGECGPITSDKRLMPAKYLRDHYDVEALRLKPDASSHDLALIEAVSSLGVHGTVFHLIKEVPDQFDDEYVVLVDAKIVIHFEIPRGVAGASPEDVKIWFLAEYRREIGQGRHRILLDRAADAARQIIER